MKFLARVAHKSHQPRKYVAVGVRERPSRTRCQTALSRRGGDGNNIHVSGREDSLSDTYDYNTLEFASFVYSNPENNRRADRCVPLCRGETGIPPEQWITRSSAVSLKSCANIDLAAYNLSRAEGNCIHAYKTQRRVYRGTLSRSRNIPVDCSRVQ